LPVTCIFDVRCSPSWLSVGTYLRLHWPAFGWMWDSRRTFLRGMQLYLSHISRQQDSTGVKLASGENIRQPVLIDETAVIGKGGEIGPNVVIGANVRIEDGVRIQNATILSGTVVRTHSFVNSSVIGRKCSIGRWARIENVSVIGDDVVIKDEIYLNGAIVLPHKSIAANVSEPQVIM
jgi:mannose-1-phosphate guanylyltransferase